MSAIAAAIALLGETLVLGGTPAAYGSNAPKVPNVSQTPMGFGDTPFGLDFPVNGLEKRSKSTEGRF